MSGRSPKGSSMSRSWTRPGGARSTRSPPGSSRWSCCAGPVASTRDSAAAGDSGPPGRSRWRCSPATRSPTGRQAARVRRSHPTLVRGAHRAPAGPAPADRPPGGGDGAAGSDRGGGGGAGRRAIRRRRPDWTGSALREAVEYLHGGRPRGSVADAIAVSTRQYAKRQETWFRHQLRGEVVTLDATRPPEKLAAEIARLWERLA